MKALFDSSVLITAVVDQLPNHAAALACYRRFRGQGNRAAGFCTTHALAECYATLTALPLSPRIQPAEAARLVRENFLADLTVVELVAADYDAALTRAERLGLSSGIVYDAIHLAAAERKRCNRLYTFNLGDFQRLGGSAVAIMSP